MEKKLYILDSYALAFRSFYAFIQNPLINSRGEETSLVFGYLNTLLRLINEQSADYLAIVTDLPIPTFRHQLYPLYKANRSEMPEEMQQQIPMFEELIASSNIAHLSQEGYEADDLIGTLATQATAAGWESFILSKDKDLMQLVNDQVHLLQLERAGMPPTIITPKEVEAKWGVPPHQLRDLLALMGDSSDNIPGVPGIGPKKGAALLKEWGSLDGILQNIPQIKAKALKSSLEESRETLKLSRELVTLRTDAPFVFQPEEFVVAGALDTIALAKFCQEHELFSLLKPLREAERRIGKAVPVSVAVTERDFTLSVVQSEEELELLAQKLSKAIEVGIDTETDSLLSQHAVMVGLCLALDDQQGFYLPLRHLSGDNLDFARVKELVEPQLARSELRWIMHNAKFDLQIFENEGWRLPRSFEDTMVASWCLNAGERVHSLDEQVRRRFGYAMTPITDLIGTGKNQISFAEVEVSKAAPYGAEDALFTLKLWKLLEQELVKENLFEHYRRDEIPLVNVLREMEGRGIAIDLPLLQKLSEEISKQLENEQDLIWESAGEVFNISSPQQLGEVLFGKLQLPHGKKTRTGSYSTNAAILEELRWEHPIVDRILSYRELNKLKGTYVDPLPEMIDPKSGRLHTSFNQTLTATGRLSSANPNLQNIPIRSEMGSRVRSAFIARDSDHRLLSADYSQIELRVLAHFSKDPALVKAYAENADIHARTASLLFQIPQEMVSEEQRRQAKAINFGVIYGMSAFRLSKEQGIPLSHAQEFIEQYFSHFSQVQRFIDDTIFSARQKGFITTLYGHRRSIPELAEENRILQARGERQAVNSVIQGSAADLMKRAMIRVEEKISESKLRAQLLLQVHDELVFEVHAEDAEPLSRLVKHEMESVEKLSIPLVAEVGVGINWLKAH